MAKAQRWTVWTLRPPQKPGGKPSKVPVANPTDQSTWSFYHAARACLSDEKIAGLGFEMYGRPEIIGVDIDNCLDELGQRSSTAAQFLGILEAKRTRCHVEISPSGKGLRIFAAETPTPFHDYTNKDTGVECYTGESGRFLAFTGQQIPGFISEGPFDPLPDEAVIWLGKHASKWKEGKPEKGAAPFTPPAEPLPDLSRRDDWNEVYKKQLKRLSKEHKAFLEGGVLGDRYASASEHLFGVMQALLKHAKLGQAYQILISADGSFGVALDHREGKSEKAKEFIWEDLQRAAKSKESHEKEKALTSSGWKDCDIVVEMSEDGAKAKIISLNILNAFKKHNEWINRLGYNTFDGRVTLDKKEVGSQELIELSAWLVDFLRWTYEPRREVFEEALIAAAKARPWNPIEDELRGLEWDSRKRIKKFAQALSTGEAVGGLELDEQILRKWLIAYVARGMAPGCDMHNVLILREREGGGFKTKFCRVMAGSPDRFSDSPGFGTDKDSAMLRGGVRIVELGEGVAVKKSDRFELKRDITKIDDHYRPPWGRVTERRPRGFLYILTANEKAMMRSDQDGLRRMWPMDARAIIDLEWIKENRDQILAEAVSYYLAGERWWWDKGEEPEALIERQGSTVQEDPFDSAVDMVISDKENAERGYTTMNEIARQVSGIVGSSLSSGQVQHLMEICQKNGLSSDGKQVRIDGRRMRLWRHASWAPVTEARVIPIRRGEEEGAA